MVNENHVVDENELEGLIFDCDGTLIDTMSAYFVSWTRICNEFGLTLSEQKFYSLAGIPVKDIIELLIKEAGKQDVLSVEEVFEKKCIYGTEAVNKCGTPRIDCVVEIAKKYKDKGIPMAVASSGNREHVHNSLKDNGIFDWFDAVITCEDVTNPKPAPDIYLLAAKKLNVDPKKCRGFEDGDVGMQSLQAAGLEAIDVRLWPGHPVYTLNNK